MSEVETNTNQLLRKKYFVDAETVLEHRATGGMKQKQAFSRVIDASKVEISDKPVLIQPGRAELSDSIKVNVRKEEGRIKGISITCPCGRHAELDCEYAE